jgi:transketolase
MEPVALRDALGDKLVNLGARHEEIVVLDADLASSTRVDRFAARFPQRFFQMGCAEQNMMSVAAGLASTGLIPFTSTFSCFTVKRALDQIRVSIAQPKMNVKLLGVYTGLFTGKTGKTHQTVQDVAVMRSMPNMRVVVPGDAVELESLMDEVVRYHGPVFIAIARDPGPVFLPPDYEFRWGQPYTVRPGRDVTIFSTGTFTAIALEAARLLARDRIEARVEHLASMKPIDRSRIAEIARESRCILTLENHSVLGGLGGAIAEIVGQECPRFMKIVGIDDTYSETGSNDALLAKHHLMPHDVCEQCIRLIERTKCGVTAGAGRR